MAPYARGFAPPPRQEGFPAELVDSLRAAGDTRLHFVDGALVLGDDFDECPVDGVHPNDLGFMRVAKGLETTIRDILGL